MGLFDLFSIGRGSDRRGARGEERYQTHLLTTELGDVVDISGSGIRIRARCRMKLVEGAMLRLNVRSPQCTIATRCRVVRFTKVREPGFRGVDISVTILDAEPGLRAALVYLGKFGFLPRRQSKEERAGARPVHPDHHERGGSPDYYEILGVPRTATAEEIRKAFHCRARPVHPDAAGEAADTQQFEVLGEAYRVLRDPQRRRAYEQLRGTCGNAA